jgi:hypothetical protein
LSQAIIIIIIIIKSTAHDLHPAGKKSPAFNKTEAADQTTVHTIKITGIRDPWWQSISTRREGRTDNKSSRKPKAAATTSLPPPPPARHVLHKNCKLVSIILLLITRGVPTRNAVPPF